MAAKQQKPLQALQTLKDKGRRKSEDGNQKEPKMRRRTSDTIEFLLEKAEKDRELKMEELKIKNREVAKQDKAAKQQQSMFASLMQQMERHRQLQQQNVEAMLTQQNNLLMAILQNRKNNSK